MDTEHGDNKAYLEGNRSSVLVEDGEGLGDLLSKGTFRRELITAKSHNTRAQRKRTLKTQLQGFNIDRHDGHVADPAGWIRGCGY